MHFALRLWGCLLVAICQLRPKFALSENQQQTPETKPNKFNNCHPEKLIEWVKTKEAAAEEVEEEVVEEAEEAAAAM